MPYRVLVATVLVTHVAFLAFVVFGGLLTWRWPRAIWPHLAAVGWGVLVVAASLPCPLTWAEDWARRRAGDAPLAGGFIDTYIEGIIYPARYLSEVRALCALTVLASWVGGYLLWRRRRAVAEQAPS
ncbi:DUF2784 domain-containing protein [Luedemannella helvata]|uniref:DUF2784 domain-containing protein n=1 Tax=Luedemannella helvata TaxID=349315 RepID=A0ABP4X9C2_9ACTN